MHRRKHALLLAAALLFGFSAPVLGQSSDAYAEAQAAFQAGNYAEAAKLFQRAAAASPAKADSLVFAARAFVHLEKFAEAEASLRSHLTVQPASAEALYLLGYVLNREDRPAESLEVYTKAAALVKPTGDDLKIVGLDYVLLNDYASATHWLEQAVARDPQNEEAWYFLGRAYYSQSRISDAGTAFRRALQLNPKDPKAENNLGLVLESEARPEEAIRAYTRAIAWQQDSPKMSEQPYLNLGSLLLEQERNEESVRPLEHAVQLAPANPLCHLKLGVANMRLSKTEAAQKELETAVRLDPGNAAAHFQLGKLYKQIHSMDRAQKEFARVEEIQSRAAAKPLAKPKE